MGQWIAIHAVSNGHANELSDLALNAFTLIHGVQPDDLVTAGNTRVFAFAPKASTGLRIESHKTSRRWAGAAGPLFFQNFGGQEALRRFVRTDLENAAEQLDGTFALFRGVPEGDLTVVTDRLGTMHVYAATLGLATVISTSSSVLAALIDADWDLVSCREFLATGTIFGQRTLFRGIEKLAPASVYHFKDGRLRAQSCYWRVADFEYDLPRDKDTTERFAASLERVMRTITSTYASPVLDLTGGLDSRAVLAATMKIAAAFETVVCGAEFDPDVRAATPIAREYGLSHRRIDARAEITLDEARKALPLTDGEFDAFEYARIGKIHSSLAQGSDASVNGSNGEICKGHWWDLLFPRTGSLRGFPARLVAAKRFAAVPEPDLMAASVKGSLVDHFTALILKANRPLPNHPNTAKMDNVYLTMRMQRWQGRIASATNHIWPAISPFSFREPMEAALTASPSTRIHKRLSRRLIEHFDPKLASFPLDKELPALPFAPPSTTNRTQVWEEIRGLLLSPNMVTMPLYRPGALEALIGSAWGGRVAGSAPARIVTLELLARIIRDYRTSSKLSLH